MRTGRARNLVATALLLSFVAVPSAASAFEDRHVFITNRLGGNIVELDETFTYQRVWFEGMALDGAELSFPNGMAFTPAGDLYIADTANDRIVAVDEAGGLLRTFTTLPRLGSSVESIYFDGTGTMFASSNPGLGRVARYGADGTDQPDVIFDPAFANLGNVNLTDAGAVLVSDFSGEGRGLREIDPASGAILRTFGTGLGRQEDVMIDGADRVFVSHFDGDEIAVFGPAPAREELYRFTAPPEAGVALTRPTGIAITHDCAILIASFASAAVFVFRHEGDAPPSFERVLRAGVDFPAEVMVGELEAARERVRARRALGRALCLAGGGLAGHRHRPLAGDDLRLLRHSRRG